MLANNATLVVGKGNYFLAPVGTDAPADLLQPAAPWENLGHTSIEDILSLTSEGGESTVLGTLQAPQLRTTYSTRTETIRVNLQQWDETGLKLFFGANMADTGDARFVGVPSNPQPTKAAFLAIFLDGDNVFGIWAPSVEILRGDDMEIADTESLSSLPLDIKPMFYTPAGQSTSYNWTWALTPLEAAPNPTGATAGSPGSFTPVGASVPNNISLLEGVVASPSTAWTAGQYVKLANGSEAHWDGTDWVTGRAL